MASESTTSRLKVGINSIAFAALALVGLLLLNVLVGNVKRVWWDLTEDKLYTLSPASKGLVKDLKSELKVRLFVSKKLVRGLTSIRTYLQDLLDQYAAASNGKFKWELIHPEESKSKKKLAEQYRIPKFVASVRQSGSKEAREIYFGVAITYKAPGASKEEIEVLPRIHWRLEKNLEYLISERISRLVRGRSDVLVVTGHQEVPAQAKKQLIEAMKGLFKHHEVKEYNIRTAKNPPSRGAVLLIMPPKTPWTKADKEKLEQYVLEGRGAMFTVDGMSLQSMGRQMQFQSQKMPKMFMPAKHGLNDLLQTWGVKISGNIVLDVGQPPLLIGDPRTGRGRVLHHPAILTMRVKPIKAPVTPIMASSLELTAAFVGKTIRPGQKFRVTPILVTSPKGWTITGPYIPNFQRRDKPPENATRGRYVIGAIAEGKLPSKYVKAGGGPGKKLAESKTRSRVVVIGDYDMMVLALRGVVPGNRVLISNLVDWLAQQEQLVKLRNKQLQDRELKLPKSKGKRIFVQILNIAVIPFFFICFGLARWQYRKHRRLNADRFMRGDE